MSLYQLDYCRSKILGLNIKNLLILILFCCSFCELALSQKIQVKDAALKESIPFVKVKMDDGKPVLADIDGYFVLNSGTKMIYLSAESFVDTSFIYTGQTELFLSESSNALEEIVVLPGENPAEKIMVKVIANRSMNHPKGIASYKCENYSKFVVSATANSISQIPEDTQDTTLASIRSFFTSQHLFLLESTAEKMYEPPYREKEIITAYKVSGLSDPTFSTFANEMQSFHFYENQFQILGEKYLSPLAFGSIRRYFFLVEDTVFNSSGDSTFVIKFRPRKDKNFNGMKGTLFINSNLFAVEKVFVQPVSDTSGVNVTVEIIQEYAFIDGKKWFPIKLSTEIDFKGIELSSKLKNSGLYGKGSTYIEHIQIGADLSKERFNAAEIETKPDANEKDSSHWLGKRTYELNELDKNTYVKIDSLSKANNLEKRMFSLFSLAQGKIPLGKFQIDLPRVLAYNEYEGIRWGLGIETSNRLWKKTTIGGYSGYGLRDKTWKYGAYFSSVLMPKNFVSLDARFQQDLLARGDVFFHKSTSDFKLADQVGSIYIRKMENQRLAELGISFYTSPRVKFRLSSNYQRIQMTQGYQFVLPSGSALNEQFEQMEASGEMVWTPGERFKLLGYKRISLGSKYPKFQVKFTQGIDAAFNSTLPYRRLVFRVSEDVELNAIGNLSVSFSGGKTWGDVPLFLLHTLNGTFNRTGLSISNTFETMLANTYYNEQMQSFFLRFTFKEIDWKYRKTSAPRFGLHHAFGRGFNSGKILYNQSVMNANNGYGEAGAFVMDLLKSGGGGFGFGLFYHYRGDTMPRFRDNIVLKLTLSTSF